MLANHCRANLLLEKEFHKLKKNPLWGIEALPLAGDSHLKWQAIIRGPKDSIWEGGAFKIFLCFTEEYNFKPPEVFFHTIPFHPNVDMKSGVPCVEFLTDPDYWKPHYGISYILLQLQVMLDNPVLENPVNLEAATMFKKRPIQYKQMVFDCVFFSKRLEAGLKPQILSPVLSEGGHESGKKEPNAKAKKKISFEDYYKTWVSIATSRPINLAQRPGDDEYRDFVIDEAHFGVLKSELEDELRRQLSDHNALMYGRFRDKRLKDEKRIAELQATKAQLLKQIYFKDKVEGEIDEFPSTVVAHVNSQVEVDFPADDEVDQLVSWTEKLPGQFE